MTPEPQPLIDTGAPAKAHQTDQIISLLEQIRDRLPAPDSRLATPGDPLNGTGPGELVVHINEYGVLLGITFHGEHLPYKVDNQATTEQHPGPDLRPIVVRRAAP